jgi:carbamoylphosphate synthase large subunit
MKTANRFQEGDRLLPIEIAKTELEAKLGVGWSRKSIKRKIEQGCPFAWKPGIHYIQVGNKLASVNVDAILRELVR